MKLKNVFLTGFTCLLFLCLPGCKNNNYERKIINPWTWQNKWGFVQANKVTGAQEILFCAGQISVDKNGNLLYPNDMEKQMSQIMDNLETLFKQADVQLSNIVRITYYTTDIPAFGKANLSVLSKRLKKSGCKPATSLIGIASLARPGCVVEFEVTAVR